MKTKNSIRLLAVAVLASTLLLGACGNKKKKLKMTMLIRQRKRHQVQRQALLTKIVNLKLQQAPLLQKKLSPLLISQRLLQINRKQQQRQKQSGIKNLLLSRRLLKSHQIKKEHKQNRISQLMIQQLIANFKTSRQNITNVIKES